jgi:hypothetical protein
MYNTFIQNKTGNATNVKHTGMSNMTVMVHTLSKDRMHTAYRQNLKNILFSYLPKSEYFASVYDT